MPCIGPLHRPRGGPKPDFNFAYLSHPPTLSCKCHKSKKISSSQSLNGGGLWLTALVVNLWTKLSDVGNSVAPNRRKGNSECSHYSGICICPNFRIFRPSYLLEICCAKQEEMESKLVHYGCSHQGVGDLKFG